MFSPCRHHTYRQGRRGQGSCRRARGQINPEGRRKQSRKEKQGIRLQVLHHGSKIWEGSCRKHQVHLQCLPLQHLQRSDIPSKYNSVFKIHWFMKQDYLMGRKALSFLTADLKHHHLCHTWMTCQSPPCRLIYMSGFQLPTALATQVLLHGLKCPTLRGSRFLLPNSALGICSTTWKRPQEQSPSTAHSTTLHETTVWDQESLNSEKASFTHTLILQELTARGRNASQWDQPARLGLHTEVLFSNFARL